MNVFGAFAIVDKKLKTGTDSNGKRIDAVRQRTFPTDIENQLIYVSSASSTDTKFYRLYREFAKKQIEGDPNYCVIQIDCNLCFHPTLHGEVVAPLLSKSQVENEMKTNREKALREYYCTFTTDAGTDAIVRRSVITRNEETRVPLLENDTGDKKFIIAYDPARSYDNSVILVMEVYTAKDAYGKEDVRGRLVNCINLMDVGRKKKTPMRTPEQIEYLKQVILDYNAGADAYGNIIGIFIDAGAGGGGVNIADYLMPDWTTPDGTTHRGLIDREYSADYVSKFPNAVDKVRLISPSAYKSSMYESLIDLVNQDKISFTATYDGKGYLTIFSVDDAKRKEIEKELKAKNLNPKLYEEALKNELAKAEASHADIIKLDWYEESALVNLDALKEEVVNMVRKKRESGKDSFELTPEKANTLHDDRAYTLALASWGLSLERRKKFFNKRSKTNVNDFVDGLVIRRGSYGGKTI